MDQVAVEVAVVAMVVIYQLIHHNPVVRAQQEPFVLCGPVIHAHSHLQMQDHLNFLEKS